MVEITNMKSGEKSTYLNMCTSEALVCAFHQSRGDYNTWTYGTSNHPEIKIGKYFLFLGDFAGREYLKRNDTKDPFE